MCSVMGAISGVLGIMGTVASSSAQAQAIDAQNKANDYNAQVAMANAQLSAKQAQDAIDRGEEDVKTKAREIAQTIGTQKSTYLSSGVELAGSAVDTIADTAAWGEYDKQTIRDNADKEAWNYDMQAANYTNEANMLQASKRSYSPFGSLLSGVTSVGMGLANTYSYNA